MRALGIIVLVLWMAWISYRVEVAVQTANETCREMHIAAQGHVPIGKCGDIVLLKTVHRLLPEPERGSVSDSASAIAIARGVLVPIYCANGVRDEATFTADAKEDRWIVTGTFHCAISSKGSAPTAQIEIVKNGGRIIDIANAP